MFDVFNIWVHTKRAGIMHHKGCAGGLCAQIQYTSLEIITFHFIGRISQPTSSSSLRWTLQIDRSTSRGQSMDTKYLFGNQIKVQSRHNKDRIEETKKITVCRNEANTKFNSIPALLRQNTLVLIHGVNISIYYEYQYNSGMIRRGLQHWLYLLRPARPSPWLWM